jgi:hypothetical protein
MRAWIDWARNAVKTNKAEKQKDSAAIFDVARPLLSDWLKELTRDEIMDAFYALVSESAPAGLNSAAPASASTASCSMRRPLPSAIPGSSDNSIACCSAS